ncbi:MAG: HAMP domain-containing histidine kinase [Hyphomicrobiales bacterium]|nr:HAMP domain-containing histidine kinase [Hyphomicrobiales bacterium]
MSANLFFHRAINWFIPAKLLRDRETRARARMFMFSHMFGPFLGNVIPGYLYWVEGSTTTKPIVLAVSICSFWVFPFLLKYTGAYTFLSYLSIQNLLFAILWGCYYYGGFSSPFLPWLVTVPLLAFFYLDASIKNSVAILLQIGVNIAIFVGLSALWGFPHLVSLESMHVIGTISTLAASVYVSMMALFYAGILTSQSELEAEVNKHLETAKELSEATTQAERANTAKSEFLAKMSHELRTPLNAVIGYSQILLEDSEAEGDTASVEDLNKIYAAGRHLLSLVNAILDLSKIEAGRMEVFPEVFAMGSFLNRSCERWANDPRLADRKIAVRTGSFSGVMEADAVKLEQVIDLLIDNAVRYAPTSDIEINAARRPSGEIALTIADRGPGVSAALMPTLFETFSDAHGASGAGAGLGLPLAFRLCRLMRATLDVMSSSDGGTIVEILMPARYHAQATSPAQAPTAKAA